MIELTIVSEYANIFCVSASTSASKLLTEIRASSGLSQAELARRASMTRSVINAYERGSRQPSVEAMARLATAGGYQLSLSPRPAPKDPQRASRILEQVVGLAEMLPYKPADKVEAAPLPPVGSVGRAAR